MFKLKTQHRIYASHKLRQHKGKCANLHGHQYEIILEQRTDQLDEINMVIDTHDVKTIFNQYIGSDHLHLNSFLDENNPTMEYMAMRFYESLKTSLPLLYSVTVYETPESSVTYIEE